MLRVNAQPVASHCDGISRRDFLSVGSLGMLGLGLPNLLQARETFAPFVRNKSVVLVYLSGGASHIETFDPRMDAPDGTRSCTGETATKTPGVTYGGTFRRLANHSENIVPIRSFSHSIGGHVQAHVHVLSGGTDPQGQQAAGFSMGSLAARLRGTNHPQHGLPTYQLLVEREIDGQYRSERGRVERGSWPGTLGATYAPFSHEIGWANESAESSKPSKRTKRSKKNQNPLTDNMRLNLDAGTFEDRLTLLRQLDRVRRDWDKLESTESMSRYQQQAVDLVLGGAANAFDWKKESPSTIERYDTSSISIGHKKFRPSTLGKQMLVARRLCEMGCGFVTVHSAGWDMHADGNNPGMIKGMNMLGQSLDQALSAFLADLSERGMIDDVLLVVTGDFGRTPKINKRGGRDHWARLGTLAFAGGGLNTGQVIGKSARRVDMPATTPMGPRELMGTIVHTMFDVGRLRLESGIPNEITRLIENTEPIPGLL